MSVKAQKTEWMSVEILDDSIYHDVQQICRYARAPFEDISSMVEEGILEPAGESYEQWIFSTRDFHRAFLAIRLQRELGVNLPGAAVIINLLEERR